MWKWLPIVNRLEVALDEAETARVRAEDEVRNLRARLDEVVAERDAARADAMKRSEQIADWIAQRYAQPPVFGNRYENQVAPPAPIPSSRRQARDLEQEALDALEREFFHQQP
jgi:hypothetical protein